MRKVVSLLTTAAVVAVASAALAATASAGISPTGAKTGTAMASVTFAGATCTSASFRSTWASAFTISTDLQPAFGSCTRSSLGVTLTCTNTAVLTATGSTVSGQTPLAITSLSCRISLTAAPTCNAVVSGGVVGAFTNSTNAVFVFTTGQTLSISSSTCTSTFPNGSTSMSAATYIISPATTMTF